MSEQQTNPVIRKMAALLDLAEGCSVHLTYRARRAPKGDCRECAHMWESRRELARLAEEYGVITGYTVDRVEAAVVKVRAAIDDRKNGWGNAGSEAGHQALNLLLRQLYGTPTDANPQEATPHE